MVMNFNALLNIHGYISVPQFVLATSKYAIRLWPTYCKCTDFVICRYVCLWGRYKSSWGASS